MPPQKGFTVSVVGAGRLGFRVFRNLVESHRFPLKTVKLIDGARVDGKDTALLALGARAGELKVEFLKKKFRHSEKRTVALPVFLNERNLTLLEGSDVVVFNPAGGDTLKLLKTVCEHFPRTPIVTTNGVFGFGDEIPSVWKPPFDNPEGPLKLFLERFGFIPENTVWVGTGKLIREGLPATPAVMERIAERITAEVFRLLLGKR